jgi:hypothetical protein
MLIRSWLTARGELIPLNKMERSHILNCINLILRKNGWRRDWLPALYLELEIRDIQGRS